MALSGRAPSPGRHCDDPSTDARTRPAALVETDRRLGAMFTAGIAIVIASLLAGILVMLIIADKLK